MSDIDLRYQIIVSALKLRKRFAKFMILIALFKTFLGYQFIVIVEVSNMARCSNHIGRIEKYIHICYMTGENPVS